MEIKLNIDELLAEGKTPEEISNLIKEKISTREKEIKREEELKSAAEQKKKVMEENLNKCRKELILNAINYAAALGIEIKEIKEEDIQAIEKVLIEKEEEIKPWIKLINSEAYEQILKMIIEEEEKEEEMDFNTLFSLFNRDNKKNFS